jgi:hypothetical protein
MTAEEYDQLVRSYGFKRGPHATCGEDYYYLPRETYPDELFEFKGTRYVLPAGGSGTGYLCLDPYLGRNNRIWDRKHGPIGSDISMKYFKDITAEQVRTALDQFFAKLQKCIIISYSKRYR